MPFLQSLASLFNTSGNPSAAAASRHRTRQSVVQNTMDAFSLPTARYPHLNGVPQTDSANSSPGPSRRTSTSNYTSYPPPKEAYTLADSFPELIDTLNDPVNPTLLSTFESELGCPLPPPVRESFLVADGQDSEAAISLGDGGSFFGLHFLPLEDVMREWAFWRQAEHDPMSGQNAAVLATMASAPPNWIKNAYACRGWVPLVSDRTGNYVGVDLDPGEGGSWGQVILFGRDFDRKCVLWKGEGEGGWGKWLAAFVDELESGEGWEADKSNSSDEEDDVGYTSYGGGGSYGEAGKALRLAGEYRGWTTLEAWWDKSVRKWEEMGLGLNIEEVERGLAEARRLAGYEEEPQGKGKEPAGLGIGMGVGVSAAQVEIPGSPQIPQPSTPTPIDSDVLLPPASPDSSAPPGVPTIQHPASAPLRVSTPLSPHDHPLSSHSDSRGFLSPPTRSPPRTKRRARPPPAPTPLDLPTRADVQALSAIAQAEDSGLRGGWVMNLDSTGGARRGMGRRPSAEMVDVDLEGGRSGDPASWRAEMEKQREEEKLALAGVEHRRPSPNLLGRSSVSSASGNGSGAGGYISPSPLSRSSSPAPSPAQSNHSAILDATDATPRASAREDPMNALPGVVEATNRLRRPPPAAGSTGATERDGDREVVRSRPASLAMYGAPRVEREPSTTSLSSEYGLLERSSTSATPSGFNSRSASAVSVPGVQGGAAAMGRTYSQDEYERSATPPVVYSSPVTSPSKLMEEERRVREGRGVEDLMEEIKL